MAKSHSTPADAVLVALDIAKARKDVLIEFPGQARRRRITVLNTRAEQDSFIGLLASFFAPDHRCLRSDRQLSPRHRLAFARSWVRAQLISSMASVRTREAVHNGRDKNDPKHAQAILHMLRTGMSQLYHDPLAPGISDIHELSETH